MKRAFLITGEPGCGKTRMIKAVLAEVDMSAGGFYTEEIRAQGQRQGFSIVTLDGKKAILSHTDSRSRYRVGKYGVEVDNIERVAVPAIRGAIASCDIVVIDEIGKMELYSTSFKEAVIEALESGKKVLGTVMLASHPWADMVKRHMEVEIVPVSRATQGKIRGKVLGWLQS